MKQLFEFLHLLAATSFQSLLQTLSLPEMFEFARSTNENVK